MAVNTKEKKYFFNADVERYITNLIYNEEYTKAKNAKVLQTADFESLVDMLECKRNEKDYEWMSDISLSELFSIISTDASGWANQYFQTRNFVEVKLEGSDPDDQNKSNAAKKCINATLNNRKIYHYHKYIRGRLINALIGEVYAVCWWAQKINTEIEYQNRIEQLDEDIYGEPLVDEMQEPATKVTQIPVERKKIFWDYFNYEVIDPRNIFTDNRYCYSIQEKDYIIIRSDNITYEQLKALEAQNGYINLDLVKELAKTQGGTETAKETYSKDSLREEKNKKDIIKHFDHFLRFGKFWAIVEKRDEEGYPLKISPGYDETGEKKENAELVETIIEQIVADKNKILIRFQPTPYIDSKGNPYKPVVRGLCYIHPTKDEGLSDGKAIRELQIAMSDTFNMSADRTKLATIPTLKGRKYALEDNITIYFEPGHTMEVENPDDIQEFEISDNIQGALAQIQLLMSMSEKIAAQTPPSFGQLPAASTTATAFAGTQGQVNLRNNYKSLTFEYTYLLDFYWMILQMTYQFASPETALQLMGNDAQYFDPDADYNYTPVSSNIELEYNRYKKLQLIDQFLGRLVNIQNPKIFVLINKLLAKAFELFGDEFPDYKDVLLDEKASVPMASRTNVQPSNLSLMPISNQNLTPQSIREEGIRDVMGGGM